MYILWLIGLLLLQFGFYVWFNQIYDYFILYERLLVIWERVKLQAEAFYAYPWVFVTLFHGCFSRFLNSKFRKGSLFVVLSW